MPQYIQAWNPKEGCLADIGSGHLRYVDSLFYLSFLLLLLSFFVGGFSPQVPYPHILPFLVGGSWVFTSVPFSSYSHFLVCGSWVFASAPISYFGSLTDIGSGHMFEICRPNIPLLVFTSASSSIYSHFLFGGFLVFASAPFPSCSPFSCWLVFNIGKNDLSKAFDDVENQSIGDGGARRSWKCFFTDLTLINYLHLKIAYIQEADSNIFGGAISDAILRHPNRRHFDFTYLSIYKICLPK